MSHESLIGITDPIILVDFPEGVSKVGLLVYNENQSKIAKLIIEINRASPQAIDQSYLGITKRKKFLKMSIKTKNAGGIPDFENMLEEKYSKYD